MTKTDVRRFRQRLETLAPGVAHQAPPSVSQGRSPTRIGLDQAMPPFVVMTRTQ